MIKGKIGDEKIFSVWMILAWVIIALVIVGVVLKVYSTKIDIRVSHSEILANRLADCIIEDGYVHNSFFEKDILLACNLDKDIFESGDFYFILDFLDSNGNEVSESLFKGNHDFEIQCGLEGVNFAKCFSNEIPVSYDNGEVTGGFVRIKTGSNYLGDEL